MLSPIVLVIYELPKVTQERAQGRVKGFGMKINESNETSIESQGEFNSCDHQCQDKSNVRCINLLTGTKQQKMLRLKGYAESA